MSRRKTKNADAEIFGETVRDLRARRNMTQEELAERIERGENVPTLTIILNLAKALDVDVGELLHDVARRRKH